MTTIETLAVGDIVTIAPKSERQFEVLALDDIDGQLIYVDAVDSDPFRESRFPRWVFLTYVRKVQEQEDATE